MQLLEGIVRIDDLDPFLERLDAIGAEQDVAVQAFDARYVAGRNHLQRACDLADRATRRNDTIARDPAVEILLYAAGRRQIERALEMGVSTGECPAVIVCHSAGEDDTGDPANTQPPATREAAACEVVETMACFDSAETLGEYDEDRLTEFFEITDTERSATSGTLEELVLERVAMLVVEK